MKSKRRILLVDDDRDIVRGVSIRLRAAGYDISVAHDGQAGLKAALANVPDAIVLDMRMPIMDGFTVLCKLREHAETAAVPVVVLSASVVEKGKAKALDVGASYFLEKPYDAPQLIEAVEAAIEMQQRQPVGAGATGDAE